MVSADLISDCGRFINSAKAQLALASIPIEVSMIPIPIIILDSQSQSIECPSQFNAFNPFMSF